MLFNNPDFFLFFLFVLSVFSFAEEKDKKIVLLLSSYAFYSFWDWRFLFLILISTFVDYFLGFKIYKSKKQKFRKFYLIVSIITNIGILGYFKYYNFFIVSFSKLIGYDSVPYSLNIILPVGISFYTFQTLSYTIDIYRNKFRPAKTLLDFSNFVAFFPQLVAGPIERAKYLLPQIESCKGASKEQISSGLTFLFLGYMKKVLVSDNLAPKIDHYFENFLYLDSIYLLSGLLLFSIQIYFDFSGYSDIARGLAKLMGIDLVVNFKQPYFATSPSEFWKRWHISLSTWLKDYIYISLGGNRKNFPRTLWNLIITMLLGGLWHGASWNFILWGAIHGFYLVTYKILVNFSLLKEKSKKYILPKILIFYSLVLVTWIPFRTENIASAILFFKKLIFWSGGIDFGEITFLVFILLLLLLFDFPAYKLKDPLFLEKLQIKYAIYALGIIGVVFSMMINSSHYRPFIYFQF